MRKSVLTVMVAVLICLSGGALEAATTTQTIVFFRHGEKPSTDYGQLTCQGLNRALKLYNVLIPRYGKPKDLFAPNPLPKINLAAGGFFYVRPLATIEPTAIRLGKGVNARYGYSDITGLTNALTQSYFAGTTIFVAWEHQYLVKAVQMILDKYKSGITAPAWTSGDYDALYVVKLTNTDGHVKATVRKDFQGLNNQPTACPS